VDVRRYQVGRWSWFVLSALLALAPAAGAERMRFECYFEDGSLLEGELNGTVELDRDTVLVESVGKASFNRRSFPANSSSPIVGSPRRAHRPHHGGKKELFLDPAFWRPRDAVEIANVAYGEAEIDFAGGAPYPTKVLHLADRLQRSSGLQRDLRRRRRYPLTLSMESELIEHGVQYAFPSVDGVGHDALLVLTHPPAEPAREVGDELFSSSTTCSV
jgi:hypothetical protein